jgi:hypothetical protein
VPTRPISAFRAAIATGGVSAGTALAVAGPRVLLAVGSEAAAHAGVILISGAVLLVVGSAVPPGRRTLPLLLAVAGVLLLLVRDPVLWHRYGWATVGLLLITGGVRIMVAVPLPTRPRRRDVDTFRRVYAGPFQRTVFEPAKAAHTPRHISVFSCLGAVTVDLTGAAAPATPLIEIFVTGCGATVKIVIPDGWIAVAGRVTAVRRVRMRGPLDSPRPVEDPNAEFQKLRELVKRKEAAAKVMEGSGAAVVVHVVGLAGSVTVDGGPAGAPTSAAQP